MHKNKLQIFVQVALLIAVEVVLSRFCSIQTPLVKIGFGFVPIAVCGMLFGPVWAGVAGGVADLIGATLFPFGAYFPGFTVSAALTGVIFGLCLHGRRTDWRHVAAAALANGLLVSVGLNAVWLNILYGNPYTVILPARVAQNCLLVPVQFAVIRLMQKPVRLYAGFVRSRAAA